MPVKRKKTRLMDDYKRGFIQTDLDAIVSNFNILKSRVSDSSRMLAVIKADGYGHGAVEIAKTLEGDDRLWGFAVASADEAIELGDAGIGKPILILGYVFDECYEELIGRDVRISIFDEDSLGKLSATAEKMGRSAYIHIPVDTGMGRIGIFPDETGSEFVRKAASYDGIILEGMFTHFAKADEKDPSSADHQLEVFKRFTDDIKANIAPIPIVHASNSAGIIAVPEANLDMVRAGISLYGLAPSDDVTGFELGLSPVMSVESHITYVKRVKKGTTISYGGTFTADRDMTVATIPLGYADGFPRSLSNKGEVLINGKRCRILGRICMDQFMADVTDAGDVKAGDRVVLLGRYGTEQITAEELGDLSGRFNYELVCLLNARLPHIYKKSAKAP